MSDQPTATAPTSTAGKKPPGKTYGGLTRNQWLIAGAVFTAALGYILWRRYEAKKSAAASTATATSTSTATAQELQDLEDALDQLQAQGYGGGSGSGGYYTEPTGTSGSSGTNNTTTGTSTPTTTATTTKTSTPTAKKAGAISNLQASNIKSTSFTVSWNPATNATSYSYKVMLDKNYPNGPSVKSGTTTATKLNITGLTAKSDYNFGIQGLPGGPGDNIHVNTT